MRISLFCLAACTVVLGAEFKQLPDATAALAQARADKDNVQIVAILPKMPALYGPAAAADQKAAVALIGKCAGSSTEGVRTSAFAALSVIKARGSSKYLGRWLNPPKKFPDVVPESYLDAIKAAGAIADRGSLSKLLKLTKHKVLEIAEAASRALGGYKALPVKQRKKLVFDQIDRLALLSSRGRRRVTEEEMERRAKLGAATIAALQQLTGKAYQTTDGWSKWKERVETKATSFE